MVFAEFCMEIVQLFRSAGLILRTLYEGDWDPYAILIILSS
jgi:hypothetical protein